MLDRVPYELFREIVKFSYVKDSSITSFDFDETVLPPIKATHVCRSWRAALLSDAALWSCIKPKVTPSYSQELKEILSRSRTAPLTVLIEHKYELRNAWLIVELEITLSVVAQEMYRCRQLQIIVTKQLAPFISRFFNRSAPMLRTFYLEVVGDDGSLAQRGMLKGIYGVLFSGEALPRLQHVHLQVAAGLNDLQLSLLVDLTTLRLRFVSSATIDGDILLGIFQSSPRLRVLDIELSPFRKPKIVWSTTYCDHQIPMPYLRELSLRGSCSIDIVDFVLGHLTFPTKDVKFNIMCDDLLM